MNFANLEPITADLDKSQAFMVKNLWEGSGLVPEDFRFGVTPLPPISDVPRFRIMYPSGYYQDRHDREDAKYTGPKGVPTDIYIEDPRAFKKAKLKAAIEGVKKSVLCQLMTGLPMAGLHSCFGALLSEANGGEDGADTTDLRQEMLDSISPGEAVILGLDGDWLENEQVALGLATTAIALEEIGAQVHAPDFGHRTVIIDGKETLVRNGFDEWAIAKYSRDRDTWPDKEQVIKDVLSLPQVPLSELEATRKWALSKQERFNKSHVDLSDRGNATQWIRLVGRENVRYLSDKREWLLWSDESHRWINSGEFPSESANAVSRFYYLRARRYFEIAKLTPDEAKAKTFREQAALFLKWANGRCSSVDGRKAFLSDAASRVGVSCTSANFDRDPYVMAFQNGIVSLKDGTLRPEEREDMIYRRAAVDWPKDGAEPDNPAANRMRTFINQITAKSHQLPAPNRTRYLQRRIGAALRGVNTLGVLEIWKGEGANGKSVLAKMIEQALGAYSKVLPAAVVLSSPGHNKDPEAPQPYLVSTDGVRIVIMLETKDTDYLDVPKVKQVTGGDTQAGRELYGSPTSIRPTATYFLLTQDAPGINKLDKAIIDRISITDFLCRWKREGAVIEAQAGEGVDLPKADLWLRDEAHLNADAQQWFAWWAVRGCVEYEREGIGDVPADVLTTVQDYIDDQDQMGDWIGESRAYELRVGDRARVSFVLADFNDWAKRNGKTPLKAETLTRRICARWPGAVTKAKSNGVRYYDGIGLTAEGKEDAARVARWEAKVNRVARVAEGRGSEDA